MIQIYMLNRGEDRARFLRGEPIAIQVGGETAIVQLESKLSKAARTVEAATNGAAAPPKAKRKQTRRRQYTAAFKKEVVAEAVKKGWSSYESGKHHGISGSVILRWMRDYGLRVTPSRNMKKAKA